MTRYAANGSLDPAFGGDGVVTTLLSVDAAATSLAIDGDERLVVAGVATASDGPRFLAGRYLGATGGPEPPAAGGGSAPPGGGPDPSGDGSKPAATAPLHLGRPSNAFTLKRPKLNWRKGTARVRVVVPGPGTIVASGARVLRRRVVVAGAARAEVTIAARGTARSALARRGKVRVRVRIAYTPSGGERASRTLTVRLRKRTSGAGRRRAQLPRLRLRPGGGRRVAVSVQSRSVTVPASRVARIVVVNRGRARAHGRLELVRHGATIGSRGISLRARSSAKLAVKVKRRAYAELRRLGQMRVSARARVDGRSVTRALTLVAASSSDGNAPAPPAPPTPSAPPPSGQPAPAPAPAAPPWSDGRYQGTYVENNVDLSFNVVASRLFTGPFDSFFLAARCSGDFGGGVDSTAYEPVEATIAANGDFSGSGVYNTGFTVQPWTIAGHISGGQVSGAFSSTYTNALGESCGGTTNFTAQWYGAYTL